MIESLFFRSSSRKKPSSMSKTDRLRNTYRTLNILRYFGSDCTVFDLELKGTHCYRYLAFRSYLNIKIYNRVLKIYINPGFWSWSHQELGYLAGAGAVTLARPRLHLKYLFNNSRKLHGTQHHLMSFLT